MTSIVEEIELPDGDYIDVTFFADCYWEEDDYEDELRYGIYSYNKRVEILGDVTWEEHVYSQKENEQIRKYLDENIHLITHKLAREYETYGDN